MSMGANNVGSRPLKLSTESTFGGNRMHNKYVMQTRVQTSSRFTMMSMGGAPKPPYLIVPPTFQSNRVQFQAKKAP